MIRPTFNGIRLPETEYLKDQTNSTLNMMLGSEGKPKYTQSQIKSIKKSALLEEIIPLYEAAEASQKPVQKEKKKAGAHSKVSKNKASAQSKKCHTIRKLATGIWTLEQAMKIWHEDYELQKVCKVEELEHAFTTKTRPVNRLFVTANLGENGDYIVAYGKGEGPSQS